MIFDERNIIFKDRPTVKQSIDAVSGMFKNYWKTSYDYTKIKPMYFGSKPINSKLKKDSNFMKSILYINNFGNLIFKGDFKEHDSCLENEISETEEQGCACIHATVLLYCLLYEDGYIDKDKCFLVQGLYRYDLRKDFPSFMKDLTGDLQTGLHSFLNFYGSVIDLTLYHQQKMTFDFKKTSMILGHIPSGMQLIGYNETHELVMEYAKQFANINGADYDTWIKYHKINADLYMVEKMAEELGIYI